MAGSIALTVTSRKPAGGRDLVRWLAAAFGGVLGMWVLGLVWFLGIASRQTLLPPHADAIVVLTGGHDRLEVALRLLAGGAADRLFVSGVGEKTDLAILAHRVGVNPGPLEHTVTLGHAAHSTRGNALETAAWAREHEVSSLLVVTTWFHMPRALAELRRVMPTVPVYAYPIGRLWIDDLTRGDIVRRIIAEYHKYLATLAGLTVIPVVIAARGTE